MKLIAMLSAAALAVGSFAVAPAPADAAPRHDNYRQHNRGHHYGQRRAYRGHRYVGRQNYRNRYRTRRVCSYQWRYNHRVRVCRTVRSNYRW